MDLEGRAEWLSRKGLPGNTKVRSLDISRRRASCPKCGRDGKRHSKGVRYVHEVSVFENPLILELTLSKHFCEGCEKHFNVNTSYIAPSGSVYSNRVIRAAVDVYLNGTDKLPVNDMSYEKAVEIMNRRYHVKIPLSTLYEWVVEARKSRI